MSTKIGKARFTFDRFGQVPDGVISPMILRSWERSKHLPREVKAKKLSPEEFDRLLLENKALIEAAAPILQLVYLCSMRTMVGLSSKDIYMIQEISREPFLTQLGRGGREADIGTLASNLCVAEGIPVQTIRQENYALRFQHCSFASAPIHESDSSIAGVVSLIRAFGEDLPDNALLMVSNAAKLIEQRLESPNLAILKMSGVSTLLDLCEKGVIICGDNGEILATNANIRRYFNITSSRAIVGHYVGELFDNDGESKKVLSMLENNEENVILRLLGKKFKCLYAQNVDSSEANGAKLAFLVFEPVANAAVSSAKTSAHSITDVYMPHENNGYIIGESPAWCKVKRMIEKVSSVRSVRVLIEGESGTGKEQIAKAIHAASGRRGKMIALNCGSLPRELLQSELFGYVDGAFTGAKKGGNPGKIEMADGGTLFLDEIGEMPPDMQVSLLRVLEERKVTRLGSSTPKSVDISVIAATNRNLSEDVYNGTFREDLYYRLSAVVISAPPLRDRKSDIPLLAEHLIGRLADTMCTAPKELSEDAMQALLDYNWPGNVRELLNVLEYALVMEENEKISASVILDVLGTRALPTAEKVAVSTEQKQPETLKDFTGKSKAEAIRQMVESCGGNISKAAERLNVSRNTIYRHLGKK